ncbi:septation protein SepH [Arthrobacter koreensis]|uniref:septation protein SepH n=1 Tax=Arthrobacter koreensis TaxID=199136 RepID=UPI002DBF2D7D|nr:septation protein SepH [Arthrobacter koreensis]MEB7447442.1 septation protein SepH [Arthrobacter koreensis]
MQDLRLVGVHEGGEHLLLSGRGGETFRLRIDEALRVAASRPARRAGQAAEPEAGPTMTPRDIQARIRSGASAEEVAELSGHDIAHIRRYEGPVLAEREYIARQAQSVEVAAPMSAAQDSHRSAFGDSPVNLGDMVNHRLRAFGVDPETVVWDSWRRPEGSWDVVASFSLGENSRVSVGEEPPARWTYSPLRRQVTNANRWAQLLSELAPVDSPVPARRLSAVADRVFDFETDTAPEEPLPVSDEETDELLNVLRSRRGQRLGTDEDADDALAALLAKGSIPAAHPRDGQAELEDESSVRPRTGKLSLAPVLPEEPEATAEPEAEEDPSDPLRLDDGISTSTREISILARPVRGSRGTDAGKPPAEPEEPSETPEAKEPVTERRIKPKRSSVPSWDEIVFGTKGD